MSVEHLRRLGIDPTGARNAAAFHQAYANTALRELDGLTSRSSTDVDPGPAAGERIEILRADAASALRSAGQWAVFYNASLAAALFLRAGGLLLVSGHAFGRFLWATGGAVVDVGSDVDVLRSLQESEAGPARETTPVPEAMRHPQQQAYALVTACAQPDIDDEDRAGLAAICAESPHRDAGIPVGALGLPIRHYWSIAESLLRGRSGGFVRGHLTSFAGRYSDDVLSARSNRYLWDNAAAPVEPGDIDMIGLVGLAVRRFGLASMADQVGSLGSADVPAAASVPRELGIELARNRQSPRDDDGERRPH